MLEIVVALAMKLRERIILENLVALRNFQVSSCQINHKLTNGRVCQIKNATHHQEELL